MKKINCISYLLIFVPAIYLNAQTKSFNALTIGDTIPNLTFSMLNYPKAKASILDFKGKLLILDFWSTWCSNCIAEFPMLQQLQQHFKDSIQILTVGFDSHEAGSIKGFISKRKGTPRELSLPTAVINQNDNRLDKLFPHNSVPFEIWINEAGKFVAATDQFAVNEENIRNIISNTKAYLPNYLKDTGFNWQVPLLVNGNGGDENNFLYRSVLTRYNPSISIPVITIQNNEYTRLAMGNATIVSFLKAAMAGVLGLTDSGYNYSMDYMNKITVLETNREDITKLKNEDAVFDEPTDSLERFKYQHFYNYDLVLPQQFSLHDAYGIMLKEIQALFKIQADVEKREIQCLALIKLNSDSTINLEKPLSKQDFNDGDDLHFRKENISVKQLCDYLNLFMRRLPLITDKTNIDYNINTDMQFDKTETLNSLNNKLKKFGLSLIFSKEHVDMLVIH